jgi:hypothetical protein
LACTGAKVVYPDGREEWLYPPGPSKDRAYKAVLRHKFDVQNGGEVGGERMSSPEINP